MSYNKPILNEIYLEVYYKNKMTISEMINKTILFNKNFPNIKNAQVREVNQISVKLENTTRLRCWSEDKNKLIQFFENRMAYNCINIYEGWSQFVKDLDFIIETAKLTDITYMTLCYIDKFTVNKDDFDFEKFFTCCDYIPNYFNNSPISIDLILGKGILGKDDTNKQFHLKINEKDNNVEINIRTVTSIKSRYNREYLDKMHEYCIEVFENIITNHIRENIMEGRK